MFRNLEKKIEPKNCDIVRDGITSHELVFSQNPYRVPEEIKHDHCRSYSNGTNNAGTCRIQGDRKYQEDFIDVAFDEVKDFALLSNDAQTLAVSETFKHIQENHGQSLDVGSTCCTAIAWIDANRDLKIVTGNLGDSYAYVVIISTGYDAKPYARQYVPLNTLHKPLDLSERTRIQDEGGYVYFNRLMGNLAVSRGFGDNRYDLNGFSHVPDIKTHTFSFDPATEKAFVIVASDGIEKIIQAKLCGLVIQHHLEPTHVLANKIGDSALKTISDNVTVGVLIPSTIPSALVVGDGHGGASVAENTINHFFHTLQVAITQVLNPADFAKINDIICAENNRILEEKAKIPVKLRAVRDKYQAAIDAMKVTYYFHVFIKPEVNNAAQECNLIFAMGNHKIRDAIQKMGEKHLIPFSSYSYAGNDNHPSRYRLEIKCSKHNNFKSPPNFDAFIAELQRFLMEELTTYDSGDEDVCVSRTPGTMYATPSASAAVTSKVENEPSISYNLKL